MIRVQELFSQAIREVIGFYLVANRTLSTVRDFDWGRGGDTGQMLRQSHGGSPGWLQSLCSLTRP